MRSIRFRGWNIKSKRMIDCYKVTPLALNKECLDTAYFDGLFLPFHKGIILMQFTGLYDRNNKEIWEGDIVSFVDAETKGTIEYHDGSFWIIDSKNGDFPMHIFEEKDIEVVGNIYQNKGLLEEK